MFLGSFHRTIRLKCYLLQQFPLDDTSSSYNALWRMGAGAFAGMFATLLTHPIDVIRAKLTVQSQNAKVYRGTVLSLMYDVVTGCKL